MISSSSSNWLDRLRSSRGFPTGEEPDLDRFISSSSSGSVESAATQSESARREKITPKWAPPPGEFAGVLCDLFNMGGADEEASRTFAKKKSSRKQPNPRFFCADLLPSSSSENNLNNNNNNSTNNNTSNNNSNENDVNFRVEDELNLRAVEDEDEDEGVDLKAYTRSEVTVIDTSFEEWKSDKWVFRKNDEWRIKDKKKSKGKSRVFSGEKKKKKLLDNQNLVDDDNQLMKKKIEDLSSLHPNKGRPRKVKEREPFVGKVPRKRFPCPRPPEKTRNESSPVVLIKSIPLNDTDTIAKISKTPHKKRPKQMKIV